MAAVDSHPEILEVFEECQLNHLAHDRLCVKLKNIYDNTRFSVFADDFLELCRYSLVSSERSLYRERTVDFITKFALFCGKDSNEDGVLNTIHNRILLRLIIFCIKYNECPNPAVRFRCMQIIHKLLDGIGDNGILPGEIYTKLQDVLLRRVYDVKVSVRVEAIKAISRMQDPNDAQCNVVEAFMWLTRHDPTAEVRRAAAAAMVLTTRTLGHLLERCRDVADNVRRTAYKILADRSIIRPLSIAKRIRILQDGLSDRSEDVRKATKALILSWFNASNRDPILLLHRLDPECEAETCQKVLDNLFDILSLDELLKVVQTWAAAYLTSDHVLKSDCLTPDSAFFWRALIQFIRKKEAEVNELRVNSSMGAVVLHENDEVDDQNPVEQIADLIQPTVCIYVDFVKNIVDKFTQSAADQQKDVKVFDEECIVEQILIIGGLLDVSEEYGRRRLLSVVHDWITSQQVSANLAPQLLKLYAILEPSVKRRVNKVIEMISELCEPTEPEDPLPAPITTFHSSTILENCVSNKENEPRVNQTAISKKKEINIRLKIASLEVRLNEINESLHNCITRKEFERATELRDECNKLEAERSQLLHELHGTVLPVVTENVTPSNGEHKVSVTTNMYDNNNSGTSVKRDADGNSVANGSKNYFQKEEEVEDDDDDDEEAESEDDDPIKRCSPAVLHKANRLAALLIQQSPTLWTLPASLRSLLDTLILPSIQHTESTVRNQAILALGLCCTTDLPLAMQYIHVFYSAMRVDNVTISETALGCIIDCLLIYGFRPFHDANINLNARLAPTDTIILDDDDEDDSVVSSHDYVVLARQVCRDSVVSGNQSHASQSILVRCNEMSRTAYRLLKPITSILEKEDCAELRSPCALGLAKLLIYDRVISSQILSLLILLWFNPLSDETPKLRHGLAYFFSDYVCAHGGNRSGALEHQLAIADAVLPTLTTLIRAPASSTLSEVDPYAVACLLARLTDTTHLLKAHTEKDKPDISTALAVAKEKDDEDREEGEEQEGGDNETKPVSLVAEDEKINNPYHDRLVSVLAAEILKAPQSAEAKLYLRMLSQLRPSSDNVEAHRKLLKLIDSMSKFADRSLNLMLRRFRKQLIEKMQRFGIDPTEKSNKTIDTTDQSNFDVDRQLNHSLSSNNNGDGENVESEEDSQHQHQPTLLASARANLHVLNSTEPKVDRQHNATMVFGQLNRTLAANITTTSLLDKSHNILAFSSSDDDTASDIIPVRRPNVRISLAKTNQSTKTPSRQRKSTSTASRKSKVVPSKSSSATSSSTSTNRRNVVESSDDEKNDNRDESSDSTIENHPVTTRDRKKIRKSTRVLETSSPVSIRSTRSSSASTCRSTRSSLRSSLLRSCKRP